MFSYLELCVKCVLINPPVSTVVSLGSGSIRFSKGFGEGVSVVLDERASDCLGWSGKGCGFDSVPVCVCVAVTQIPQTATTTEEVFI